MIRARLDTIITKAAAGLPHDPRYYQIATLASLLVYIQSHSSFVAPPWQCVLMLASCQICQYGFARWFAVVPFDPRSPLISGLSLCLLLRTNTWQLAVLAAFLTIGSKFLIRRREGHIFNPTNFALVVLLLLTSDQVWLSPGQWGSGALLALFLVSAGMIVLYRAARSDVTLAYLGFVALLLFARALYLGDPLTIPMRQLQSGGLLIFAFFMISDPKTVPNARSGRILFAFLVATIGIGLQFNWVMPIRNGIFYALALGSPLVPVINYFFHGSRYQWRSTPKPQERSTHEHASSHLLPAAAHR